MKQTTIIKNLKPPMKRCSIIDLQEYKKQHIERLKQKCRKSLSEALLQVSEKSSAWED
jgi:hypothetical protein